MSDRFASMFVCDDLLVALNGKFTISGLYTGDIAIPSEPWTLGQLVVVFNVETDVTKPFQRLALQVSFPGESPRTQEMQTNPLPPMPLDRNRVAFRMPFLIPQPVLRPGPIEAKVLHEEGELPAGMLWITLQK
jgi:hypothetical protein